MHDLLMTLHVVAAIFLIGPLVATMNGGARVLRGGEAGQLGTLARLVTVYGWASLVVPVFGAGLVQDKYQNSWSDAWIIVSLVLYVVATALVLAVLAPLLRRAAAGAGGSAALAGRAAAVAGIASLCYVAIAVLMVYQPGGSGGG
jgi:uncharacterized membrane protein